MTNEQYIALVSDHMRMALGAAVPLWVFKLRQQPWKVLSKRAHECAHIVAEKGDILQYRGKKPGETAAAFNALAEGLAILSFCPGGVTFLGEHWENKYDG